MPKAIISNRIYLDKPTDAQLKQITDALTYRLEKNTFQRMPNGKLNPKKQLEFIKSYTLLPKGIITIPQGRLDLIPEEYEVIDRRIKVDVPFPTPKFPLRDSQIEVFNKIEDTCFINAKVGWGKTFTALHIAAKLGQKTLIITHTASLRDQWLEEAEALFGMGIGVIGGGKFDIEDHAIVVGNIQSLVKYKTQIAKEFGTVILDEAHHVPATTFTEVIDSLYARYRIGLSGTMDRKDGKHVLLTDFFSDTVHQPPVDNTLLPVVNILKPGVFLENGLAWAQKINKLLYDEEYQQFIAKLTCMAIDKGHSVLVIASRIEFLEKVKEYVGESCMLVTGDTSFEDRKRIAKEIDEGTKSCIAGSRQIFSEGISVNRLSAVILAEPMAYDGLIEQIIGRVMRKHDEKIQPEVYDINFSDYSSRKQNESRLAFYMNKGWDIVRC
jgi:superfamily II DNA or RNA helicase